MTKDPSSVIHAYKRRQQTGPLILWGAVTVLVLAGIVLLVIWLGKPDSPLMMLLASPTPTPTITPSPTNTPLPTETPTQTLTPTNTASPTPSAPFEYTVQDGDSLFAISQKFNLGDNGIALLLLLNPFNPDTGEGIDPTTQSVFPGQKIMVPNPDMQLPTATPVSPDLARGTKVTYTIQSGDTLETIASLFNSTVDDILLQNPEIENSNSIQVGQQIIVRVNLVTPTPTVPPTITPGPSPTPPSPFTPTPKP
jgi:LysM repeat protein